MQPWFFLSRRHIGVGAIRLSDNAVQGQAMMISLNNIYGMLTGVMIIALLLTVLLPRPAAKAPAGAH